MKNVLVVDDDPTHQEEMRTLLSSTLAAKVSSASNGEDAMALLASSEPYDLLLLDLNMANFDGIRFLEHLRQINFQGAIILASAARAPIRKTTTHLGKGYGLNFAGIIERPVTIEKLAPALAHVK